MKRTNKLSNLTPDDNNVIQVKREKKTQKICPGDGSCFHQVSCNPTRYERNLKVKCDKNCVLVKCPNYEICEEESPKCHWTDECDFCEIQCMDIGGTNAISLLLKNAKLDICTRCKNVDQKVISRLKCSHLVCIPCFRVLYLSDNIYQDFLNPEIKKINNRYDKIFEKPKFPYSKDVEDKYHEEDHWEDNPEMHLKYPLIEIWNQEDANWEEKKEKRLSPVIEKLYHCSICHQ